MIGQIHRQRGNDEAKVPSEYGCSGKRTEGKTDNLLLSTPTDLKKPNYGSVIVYTEEAFYKFDENIRNYMMIQTDLHGLRGPMCKICFKPFASPQTLARHIEVQHIDSGVPYPCHYCEKIFKNKSHRSVHVHREHRAEHREYLDSKQQHNLTNLPPNWPSKTNTEIFHGHQNIQIQKNNEI